MAPIVRPRGTPCIMYNRTRIIMLGVSCSNVLSCTASNVSCYRAQSRLWRPAIMCITHLKQSQYCIAYLFTRPVSVCPLLRPLPITRKALMVAAFFKLNEFSRTFPHIVDGRRGLGKLQVQATLRPHSTSRLRWTVRYMLCSAKLVVSSSLITRKLGE